VTFLEKNQNIIRKSNELIEARYKLSIAEQRLILLLASEISPDDENFKSYQIKVTDFAKMFGLDSCKAMYKEVQKAAKELVCKRLDLSKNGEEIYTTWLSYVKYIDGSGVINLEFHSSLKPYFLQLKSHFTQYHLNYVMDFKSQYSMRLYELLKMDAYKVKNGKFEKYFEVAELRLLLGVDEKDYALFAGFRRFAIEPAISEISNKTDLFIHDVKYGKTGRKITNVTFLVGVLSKDQTNLKQANLQIEDLKTERNGENHTIINSLVSLGFSIEIAKKYKNKHGVKKIERNIAYTLAKKQEGKVDDIPSYLNTAIENDYGNAWDIKRKKDEEEKKKIIEAEKSKKDTDVRKRKESKEKQEKALASFYELLLDVQDRIKTDFLESAKGNTFVLNEWAKMQRANQNPIERPSIRSMFVQFLMDKNLV